MNRCATLLADACISKLADFFNKSGYIQADKLTFNTSLKYLLINDSRIAIDIESPTRFKVSELNLGTIVANGPAISEARLSDFLLGSNRVRTQYETVLSMKNSKVSAAWLLVSTYYCAYFAAIELSKIFNRISISFEQDDLTALREKAVGDNHAQFFANGQSNFVGAEKAGNLVFQAVGARPHHAAWENARFALSQVLEPKSWVDGNFHIQLLSDPDYYPSRIRNTWNYRRSDYFGRAGENYANEFKKLVGNHTGASSWLTRTAVRPESMNPCIVAVLCETLANAIIDAGKRAGVIINQKDK